jgi:hypothetical protein
MVGLLSWFCILSSLWLTTCLQRRRFKVSRSVLQSPLHCLGFSLSNVVFSLNLGFSQILYHMSESSFTRCCSDDYLFSNASALLLSLSSSWYLSNYNKFRYLFCQVVNFWAQRRVVSRIFIATMVGWILLFIYRAGQNNT